MFREVPVRRSRALLLNFEADGIAGYDFLSRMSGHLHPTSIAILSAFSDWRPLSSCVSELSHKVGSYSVVAREVIRLLDYGFLIVAGTSLGDRNEVRSGVGVGTNSWPLPLLDQVHPIP